jgi:inosose dehydratase
MCFSSGSVDAIPDKRAAHLETHTKNLEFVKAVGGRTVQILSTRPKDHTPTDEEFDRLGALLNEIGKRAVDLGITLAYHNHMNAFGEAPEEVAHVLKVTDPRYLSLLLDVAHYKQGGGDPVHAVSRHADRIAILHFKDVVSPVPGDTRPARQSYEWVELGRGSVDLPGVLAALKKLPYNGPAVVELDKVPDPSRSTSKTPKECAEYNRRYVVETLGLTL